MELETYAADFFTYVLEAQQIFDRYIGKQYTAHQEEAIHCNMQALHRLKVEQGFNFPFIYVRFQDRHFQPGMQLMVNDRRLG